MYDYGLSVLSHYGLTASGTMRVRGALLCHTEQGDKLISEFGTAAEKLEQRYLLQCRITESGLLRCDQILRNEEGALATRGDDGGTYGSSSAGENGIPEEIPRGGVHPPQCGNSKDPKVFADKKEEK